MTFVQWRISGNTGSHSTNTYTITNIRSNLHLSFREETDSKGNKTRHLEVAASARQWTIEPRSESFVCVYACSSASVYTH